MSRGKRRKYFIESVINDTIHSSPAYSKGHTNFLLLKGTGDISADMINHRSSKSSGLEYSYKVSHIKFLKFSVLMFFTAQKGDLIKSSVLTLQTFLGRYLPFLCRRILLSFHCEQTVVL